MSTSLIVALHARYEAAWATHAKLDHERPRQPERWRLEEWATYRRIEEGMQDCCRESDAVQVALLHQQPQTDEDLTILALHIATVAVDDEAPQGILEAFQLATGTMFDYLVGKGRCDIGIGEVFRETALGHHERQRTRAGEAIV